MSPWVLCALLVSLAAAGFFTSLLATRLMIAVAPRLGLIDRPGGRKAHDNPTPLGGGTGIFAGVALPLIAGVAVLAALPVPAEGAATVAGAQVDAGLLSGAMQQVPLLLTFLAAGSAMYVLGLLDDRRPLGPFVKLGVQLAVTLTLVVAFAEVRLLTVIGTAASVAVTVLWISGVTNAFNFLDNMNGLAGGVAAICGVVLLVTSILAGQIFVPATLAVFVGACCGFLVYNFPNARIFMGDSGSLFVGLVLGVMTVRTTYLLPGQTLAGGWYGVFAPLVVLAVPLYDMIVVSVIRIARGQSPFVGDTNHFSHRLVRRGMTRRNAVLCVWLVTAATGVAALLLPLVQSQFAAWLIFLQTLLILGVVFLLERSSDTADGVARP